MSSLADARSAPALFPAGGGEMGDLIRNFDWSRTSIGPLDGWPQSLKTTTNLLLLSPVPIVLLWGEDGVMIYNDAYSEFAGQRHPSLLGSKVREGWPEVADFNDNIMKVGLAGGTLAYRDQELVLTRRGMPEAGWMDLDYSPVVDESGRPAGVIAIVVETTERVLSERQMRASEGRLRALVDASSDVIYRMSPDWKEMQAFDGRGFLADNAGARVAWVDEYLLPEDHPQIWAVIDKAVANRDVFELEHRVRTADGGVGWTLSRAVPMFGDDGEIVEWFGTATDITERRRAEQHLRLVINELNHRVKNNLAMTQAIAAQTFRQSDDLETAQSDFTSRIIALAQANDLLTGERWVSASLKSVLEQAVRPHCVGDHARLTIDGGDVHLSAKTALALSMAMHELATNAVKYGAWSNADGRVEVTWETYPGESGQRLRMVWREAGGPEVRPPRRRGFGSRLVERGLAAEMSGQVDMVFDPDGLICRIDAPLSIYDDE